MAIKRPLETRGAMQLAKGQTRASAAHGMCYGLLVTILTCALVAGGCSLPLPDHDEIVGTWAPTDDSPDLSDGSFWTIRDTLNPAAATRIVLLSDSTFFTTNFPLPSDLGGYEAVSGKGDWSLGWASGSGYPKVVVHFTEMDNVPGRYTFNLSVSEWMNDLNFGAPKLFFFIGDPDSGNRFSFFRLSDPSGIQSLEAEVQLELLRTISHVSAEG